MKTDTSSNPSSKEEMVFQKASGKVLLIGDSIQLFDRNLNVLKDITFLNRQQVEILEVSEKYYKSNYTSDHCEEFKYVKIQHKEVEGYVDGRNVFELTKSLQNKTVSLAGNEVSIIVTKNFGVGATDENGLTFCSSPRPVLFSNTTSNYEGLIKIVKNEFYSNDFPYFQLFDDDGAYDEIVDIRMKENNFLVKVKSTFQEGGADILYLIYKHDNDQYLAKVLEFVPFDEPYLQQR